MTEPSLFDPDTTITVQCASCGATRQPGQDRVPTCAHDLEPQGKRPKACLNTIDPATARIPF